MSVNGGRSDLRMVIFCLFSVSIWRTVLRELISLSIENTTVATWLSSSLANRPFQNVCNFSRSDLSNLERL